MAAAYVRALATVLLMGRVAVLDRYRAVPAARLSSCSLHPRTVARLPSCSLHPRAAARPLAAHAASLRLGVSARSPARPCRRPRVPQPPACRRGTLPPPSGTAAARMPKGCPATRPRAPQPPAYRRGALPPALEYRSRPHAEGVPCHPPRPRSRPCARAGSRSGYTHTKSPGPNGPGDSPSGWRDLNPRPLRPERSALPSCATPRCPMSIAIPRRKTQTEIGGQWEVCATPQR